MADNSVLTEITEDFKTMVLERFGSPLLFSFTVSWTVINYPVLFILFSSAKIHYRLKLLKWYFNPSDFLFYHSHVWAGPILVTIFYVFVYPYINRRILRFVIDRKMDEIRDRAAKEKLALFTYEHIEKLKSKHAVEIQRCREEINNLNERESELSSSIAELNSLLATYQRADVPTEIEPDFEPPRPSLIDTYNLSPSEILVLTKLGNNETANSPNTWESNLLTNSELQPVKIRFALDKLYEKHLILRNVDNEGDIYYELSLKGRECFDELEG